MSTIRSRCAACASPVRVAAWCVHAVAAVQEFTAYTKLTDVVGAHFPGDKRAMMVLADQMLLDDTLTDWSKYSERSKRSLPMKLIAVLDQAAVDMLAQCAPALVPPSDSK